MPCPPDGPVHSVSLSFRLHLSGRIAIWRTQVIQITIQGFTLKNINFLF